MDRKRARFSLSRKRKKSNTDEEDTNRNFCVLDESSKKVVLPLDEISVESKENRTETQDSPVTDGKVKSPVRPARIPESGDNRFKITQHNNAEKSITTWFKKPCDPKTVSCPMCGKVVILSKINQHLDNNCESYFGQHNHISSKTTSKANRGPGTNSHKEKKETVPGISDDKTATAKDCKVDAKSPQSKDENMSTSLEVSSKSETTIILDPDVPSLERKSDEICRNKECCDTLNNGCDVTCEDIAKQESSHQGSCAKSVAETEEILTHDNGNLQTKQMDLLSDQSKCLTTEGQTCNINLAEENSEDSKDHENKDYEPYYLTNFKLVLNNVLSNEDDRKLFNESDNYIIDTFNGMSPEEQKLYIRLFQRKRGWFRCSKLDYPKISSNLRPILNSLVQKGKVK